MHGPLGHVKPATRNRLNVFNTREQKPASNSATTVHDRKQNRKRGPSTVIHARDQRKIITGTAYSIGARWTKMCKTIIFTRLGSTRAPKFRGKCKYTQRAPIRIFRATREISKFTTPTYRRRPGGERTCDIDHLPAHQSPPR